MINVLIGFRSRGLCMVDARQEGYGQLLYIFIYI